MWCLFMHLFIKFYFWTISCILMGSNSLKMCKIFTLATKFHFLFNFRLHQVKENNVTQRKNMFHSNWTLQSARRGNNRNNQGFPVEVFSLCMQISNPPRATELWLIPRKHCSLDTEHVKETDGKLGRIHKLTVK